MTFQEYLHMYKEPLTQESMEAIVQLPEVAQEKKKKKTDKKGKGKMKAMESVKEKTKDKKGKKKKKVREAPVGVSA
jgi:4-aminobutyrate aminotransferase-like enzyme